MRDLDIKEKYAKGEATLAKICQEVSIPVYRIKPDVNAYRNISYSKLIKDSDGSIYISTTRELEIPTDNVLPEGNYYMPYWCVDIYDYYFYAPQNKGLSYDDKCDRVLEKLKYFSKFVDDSLDVQKELLAYIEEITLECNKDICIKTSENGNLLTFYGDIVRETETSYIMKTRIVNVDGSVKDGALTEIAKVNVINKCNAAISTLARNSFIAEIQK